MIPHKPRNGNWAHNPDQDENIDTNLYPFRSGVTQNPWYTSKTAKRAESFGYTYPETASLTYSETDGSTTEDARRKLRKNLIEIYNPPAEKIRQSRLGNFTAGQELLPSAHVLSQIKAEKIPATVEKFESLVQALPKHEELLNTYRKPLQNLAPGNKYLEWLTNIRAEKHALDGAYTVHIFLGPTDEENTALWPSAPTHVGTFAPLGQPSDTRCGKCQEDQRNHVKVTSQIPLTTALIERYLAGIIDNLSEESVIPYLTQHLHWRATKVSNSFDITLELRY